MPQESGGEEPAFSTKHGSWCGQDGLSKREYAAIQLRVPNSGQTWLDEMIAESLRDQFAGQALDGLLAYSPEDETSAFFGESDGIDSQESGRLAAGSYVIADATLSARKAVQP